MTINFMMQGLPFKVWAWPIMAMIWSITAAIAAKN
jgi:hypothetical protein